VAAWDSNLGSTAKGCWVSPRLALFLLSWKGELNMEGYAILDAVKPVTKAEKDIANKAVFKAVRLLISVPAPKSYEGPEYEAYMVEWNKAHDLAKRITHCASEQILLGRMP
jgi:hypothetical protein